MSSRAFGPMTPRELLSRAEHEVQKLEEAIRSGFDDKEEARREVGSIASTCAGTLWNICDWLANSADPHVGSALAGVGLKKLLDLQNHVRSLSPELTICWELTNSSKHLKLTGHLASVSQISEAILSVPPSRPTDGQTPRPPSNKAYQVVPKVKTDSGANVPALDVYRGALVFWKQFFQRHGL